MSRALDSGHGGRSRRPARGVQPAWCWAGDDPAWRRGQRGLREKYEVLGEFFAGITVRGSPDLSHLSRERAFARLQAMVDLHGGPDVAMVERDVSRIAAHMLLGRELPSGWTV